MFIGQPLCCNAAQLRAFKDQVRMAATFLKDCGSCWRNFRLILCQQMCSPDQSTFMEVLLPFKCINSSNRNCILHTKEKSIVVHAISKKS